MNHIKYGLATDSWDHKEIEAINEVIKSNRYTMGPKVKEFENSFADRFGSKYAVMVNSGSSANLLAVASLLYSDKYDLSPGDEIIVPAVSWSTTFYPVSQYNLKLVFVDVNLDTLNLDDECIEDAITEKTKAIFAVNLLGNPCHFKNLKKICDSHNLILIEDNCESLGAIYDNKFTGTFGSIGTFSFFFSHHMQTMEGGMILTNDEELQHLCISLRAHGWIRDLPEINHISNKIGDPFKDSFRFVTPGYSVRPLEMSGAIGLVQLSKVEGFIDQRRKNAIFFNSLFENEKNILIQKETGRSSWFGFSLILKNELKNKRNEFVSMLRKNNVECRPIVAGNFTKNPVIEYLNHAISGNLKNAENIDNNGLFIGNDHRDLEENINYFYKLYRKF